jgi:hypothetical protein
LQAISLEPLQAPQPETRAPLQLLSFEFAAIAIQTRPLRTIKTQTEIQHACSNREGIFDGDQPLQSKNCPL